ncbi:MAG: HDOD domain-containing protein, partial [Solirubrobacteraceae bacterium]
MAPTATGTARAPTRSAESSRPSLSVVRSQAQPSDGHGRRLTDAFAALEAYPALAESRARLLAICGEGEVSAGEIVAAVESDVALAIAVLRLSNRVDGPRHGSVDNVVDAVEVLSPQAVHTLATRTRTFDFFERTGLWEAAPERFRLHAVATQRAADRLATEIAYEARNRLMVSSLLHDIGKLVLLHAYPGYLREIHGNGTPEERLQRERRELGVDHALIGGVLARRWGLPKPLASAIERHHADDAEGDAAIVRLADMLAHYGQSQPVTRAALLRTAKSIGLGARELRRVMYDLPYP